MNDADFQFQWIELTGGASDGEHNEDTTNTKGGVD
jgi:hypothetical protein